MLKYVYKKTALFSYVVESAKTGRLQLQLTFFFIINLY